MQAVKVPHHVERCHVDELVRIVSTSVDGVDENDVVTKAYCCSSSWIDPPIVCGKTLRRSLVSAGKLIF